MLGDASPLAYRQGVDPGSEQTQYVDVIFTDLHPHVLAWQNACKLSKYGSLRYAPEPVDAAPLAKENPELAQLPKQTGTAQKARTFHLFNLAFHHFDDELALKTLENTLQTSGGFAIFEVQGRDVGNVSTILSSFSLLLFGSWWWYWGQWKLLFWVSHP